MSRPHRNALPVGYRLHWYVIERILGQGGFGITYLARDTNLHQHVAVKEYLPVELAVREHDDSVHPVSEGHGESFQWGLARFLDEARTLARFDHPNIVRVLSVFEHNNTAYMVMRYEKGRSLQEMLRGRATLEEAELLAIVLPVLDGLARVHAQGFIHRDIKPGNLFVRADGSPVLIDFGSARQALGQETKTLTTLVSPGFAPFEQYHSKSDRQGPWTDIYSLGATLYRAVTGNPPADALERSEGLLTRQVDPLLPAARAAAGRYGEPLLRAIDHALAFHEEDRPRSVAAWLEEIEVAAEAALAIPTQAESAAGPAAHASAPEPGEATRAGPPPSPRTAASPADPGADPDAPTQVLDPGAPAAEPPSGAATGAAAEREALYRAFVGPRGTNGWLARFARFDAGGRRLPLSWSWPAALLTVPWLAWRRLYRWIPVYLLAVPAAALAVLLPLSAAFFGGGTVPPRVGVPVLALAAVLLPGLLGSALYWRRARRVVAEAAAGEAGDRAATAARRGGTSWAGAAFTSAMVAVLVLGLGHAKRRLSDPSLVSAPSEPAGTRASAPAADAPAQGRGDPAAAAPAGEATGAPAGTAVIDLGPAPAPSGVIDLGPAAAEATAPGTPATTPDGTGARTPAPATERTVLPGQKIAQPPPVRSAPSPAPAPSTATPGRELERSIDAAREAWQRGDHDRARAQLRRALELDPKNKELRRLERRLKKGR